MVVVGSHPSPVGAVKRHCRVGQRSQFHVYPVDPSPLGLEHKDIRIIVVLQHAGHGLAEHCSGGAVEGVGMIVSDVGHGNRQRIGTCTIATDCDVVFT